MISILCSCHGMVFRIDNVANSTEYISGNLILMLCEYQQKYELRSKWYVVMQVFENGKENKRISKKGDKLLERHILQQRGKIIPLTYQFGHYNLAEMTIR